MSSLVSVPTGLVGCDVDLGTVTLTDAVIRNYAAAIGDAELVASGLDTLPLGLALALRGAPTPSIATTAGTVSVHGGHTIVRRGTFAAGHTYRLRSRIVGVFEKSGRSGPLAVVARRASLSDADDAVAVTVDEQEIVRWRPQLRGDPDSPPSDGPAAGEHAGKRTPRTDLEGLQVGDVIAEVWPAPSCAAVAAYSRFIDASSAQSLFTDAALARALGYRSVIVPGPVQSAAIEAMLRRRIIGGVLVSLGLTFRMSISPGDELMMTAVVVEHRPSQRGRAIVCDLALEWGADRVATGTAELHAI